MQNSTLFLGAVAFVVIALIPIAFILQKVLPQMVMRRVGAEQAESKIAILYTEAKELEGRVKGMTARRNQLSAEQARMESEIRKMEKAILDLSQKPPLFIHEVGEARSGTSRFRAAVEYARAATTARAEGDRSQVNPVWRHLNVVDVWATNMQDARTMIDTAFPFKLGYTTQFQGIGTKPVAVRDIKGPDTAEDSSDDDERGLGFSGAIANDVGGGEPGRSAPRGARLGRQVAS